MKILKIAIIALLPLMFIQCADDNDTPTEITITDADGNVYRTITIGDQVWMLENLKTTKFNDGTPITEYNQGDDWYNLNSPNTYYQWSDTNDLNNLHEEELSFDHFGAQYNELTLTSGKLAPVGWRIPSEQDFMELENYLASDGHNGHEATALKSSTGWSAGTNGTDDYGFNALPNGYVSAFGGATGAQVICTWATSEINTVDQTRTVINLLGSTFSYSENGFPLGAGVRCIKE